LQFQSRKFFNAIMRVESCQLEAEHPLKINSRFVVSLTLPEKRKLGAEDKF
jgi:hypothetical protein